MRLRDGMFWAVQFVPYGIEFTSNIQKLLPHVPVVIGQFCLTGPIRLLINHVSAR